MRLLLLILISVSLLMCKSKKQIESTGETVFTVLLKGKSTVKELQSSFPYTITNHRLASKTQNQWRLTIDKQGKKNSKIRAALLNEEMVITVYNKEELKRLNSKNSQKSKIGPVGRTNKKQ